MAVVGRTRRHWALDRQLTEPGQINRFGNSTIVAPIAALAAMIAILAPASYLWHPRGVTELVANAAVAVVFYGVLAIVIRQVGAPAARASGGWGNAFGLRRPRRTDAYFAVPAMIAETVFRAVVVVVLLDVVPAWRHISASNVHLRGHSVALVVVASLGAILVAPVIEETIFRGLLLRALFQRVGFWPAALISSAVFGAFHTYEVHTLGGALVLGTGSAAFGVGQCVLTRYTGTLAAPITVHALTNAVALAVNLLG